MLSAKRGELLRAVFEHPFDHTTCFLCAEPLTAEGRTEEHVIPKWVQQKYDLWNESLGLLNDTSIQYRQLTIPCCRKCNNERLSRLESVVEAAVSSGYDAVVALPRFVLFQWLAKIFVGLLHKDLLLPFDRSDRSAGNIVGAETLKRFSIMHLCIQVAKPPFEEGNENEYCPGSVFIFRTQKPDNHKGQFDLVDMTLANSLAIRLGDVGLVADFLENGVHARIAGDSFRPYQGFPLHPRQFRELAARIFYGASLIDMQTDVKFSSTSDGLEIAFLWQPKENSSPREWKNEEYAHVLANVMGFSEDEKVFEPTKGIWTCLHNKDGSIRKLSL
jgi:hypothetical protein